MLDLDIIRSHFPAFDDGKKPRFFENAGGSFACRQTTDALHRFYTETKVQPYAAYRESATAGELMDASHRRWAEALGVSPDEIVFGPSTSMNTYVLAKAFGERLGAGDEVIVTNQDHEANTGATRRMVEAAGATLREWNVDPMTGQLHIADFESLLNDRTVLVTFRIVPTSSAPRTTPAAYAHWLARLALARSLTACHMRHTGSLTSGRWVPTCICSACTRRTAFTRA